MIYLLWAMAAALVIGLPAWLASGRAWGERMGRVFNRMGTGE